MASLVADAFDLVVIKHGGNLAIEEPADGVRITPSLVLTQPIDLRSTSASEVADRLVRLLPSDLHQHAVIPTETIRVSKGYGLISSLEDTQTRIFFEQDDDRLVKKAREELLPLIQKELGATHVCTLRPNFTGHQKKLSFIKMTLLIREFGVEGAQQKAIDQGILHDVLPGADSVAAWIQPFLMDGTIHTVVPIWIRGAYWLFFRRTGWMFPRAPMFGLVDRLTTAPPQGTTDGPIIDVARPNIRTEADVYGYLCFAVQMANTISGFVLNPFNFLDGERIDLQRQIQFCSAMSLLFSDFRSGRTAMSDYARFAHALSLLDKLTNLIEEQTQHSVKEPAAFQALLSLSMSGFVRRLARTQIGPKFPMCESMCLRSGRSIVTMHRSISKQMTGKPNEAERLAWLRSYRNLRHGTFLRSEQFRKLFIESHGKAPSMIGQVSRTLMMALCYAPETFLKHVATIAQANVKNTT